MCFETFQWVQILTRELVGLDETGDLLDDASSCFLAKFKFLSWPNICVHVLMACLFQHMPIFMGS